jgi:hypothetical protein
MGQERSIVARRARELVALCTISLVAFACSARDEGVDRTSSALDDDDAGDGGDASDDANAAEPSPSTATAKQNTPTASTRPKDEHAATAATVDPRAGGQSPTTPRTSCVTLLDCQNGLLCDGIELCVNGQCTPGVPPLLDDGNVCTKDFCDEVLGILHQPWPAGHPCDDTTVCNGRETCNGAGACVAGTAPTISDNNPCTDDSCDAVAGVVHTPRPAGDPACSDANACNGLETCDGSGGCQSGTPPTIDDSNHCTIDSCSPSTGPTHTLIPACDPTPLQEAPFETRASILGKLQAGGSAVTGATFTVTDATTPGSPPNSPRTDVSVTSASDGSFRLRLTSFATSESEGTPPTHVLVRIQAGSYIPVHRDVWLHSGHAVDLGIIRMIARDANVTNIGPAGGTATDSAGKIQVIVPAGALTTTIPVVITPILARDDMPAPLPDATPTQYGFELEPDGTTFASPITVKVSNWHNLAMTTIPAGFYDASTGFWEHDAIATLAGGFFTFETDHFSTRDCNTTIQPNGPIVAGGGGGGGGGGDSGGGPGGGGGSGGSGGGGGDRLRCLANGGNAQAGGSVLSPMGGGLHQEIELPSYRVKNEPFGIHLNYDSGLAGARSLGETPTDYGAVSHSTFAVPIRALRFEAKCAPSISATPGSPAVGQPGTCVHSTCGFGQNGTNPLRMTIAFGGSTLSRTLTANRFNNDVELDGFLHLPTTSATESVGRGLLPIHAEVRAVTGGSCLTTGTTTFGAADPEGTPTQTSLELGPLATMDIHTFVNHRLTSPFGAGWTVSELSRVFRTADVAYLARGDGAAEYFRPRAHPVGLGSVGTLIHPARDPRTGEVFVARGDGRIDRVDVLTGALTLVLSGLSLTNVEGFAIGYVGHDAPFRRRKARCARRLRLVGDRAHDCDAHARRKHASSGRRTRRARLLHGWSQRAPLQNEPRRRESHARDPLPRKRR